MNENDEFMPGSAIEIAIRDQSGVAPIQTMMADCGGKHEGLRDGPKQTGRHLTNRHFVAISLTKSITDTPGLTAAIHMATCH